MDFFVYNHIVYENVAISHKKKKRELMGLDLQELYRFVSWNRDHRFRINYVFPKEERFQGILFGWGFNNCDCVITSKSPVDNHLDSLFFQLFKPFSGLLRAHTHKREGEKR